MFKNFFFDVSIYRLVSFFLEVYMILVRFGFQRFFIWNFLGYFVYYDVL